MKKNPNVFVCSEDPASGEHTHWQRRLHPLSALRCELSNRSAENDFQEITVNQRRRGKSWRGVSPLVQVPGDEITVPGRQDKCLRAS